MVDVQILNGIIQRNEIVKTQSGEKLVQRYYAGDGTLLATFDPEFTPERVIEIVNGQQQEISRLRSLIPQPEKPEAPLHEQLAEKIKDLHEAETKYIKSTEAKVAAGIASKALDAEVTHLLESYGYAPIAEKEPKSDITD